MTLNEHTRTASAPLFTTPRREHPEHVKLRAHVRDTDTTKTPATRRVYHIEAGIQPTLGIHRVSHVLRRGRRDIT
jgi:hypothetical protein